jgi:GT2 family glycosyltransferase
MIKPPLISICIANYNGISFIDDCIQSVLKQTDAPRIEIIIHDDASRDKSATYIRETYPDIQLIESDYNVGFCVANNRMASIAKGEYLLLLNNDAALMPDALSTLFQAATQIKQPAILGLPQYNFDTGELIDIGSLLDPFLNPIPNTDPQRNDVGMIIGACMWVPKILWDEIGGFPEWFDSIGEDLYLCCVARLAGYPVQAIDSSGYRHLVGASFGGGKALQGKLVTTFRRRALSEKNKTYVMAITYPAPAMQLILPIHLALLLLEGILLTILKFDVNYIRSIYFPVFQGLIKNRRQLTATRKTIQHKRTISLTGFFSTFSVLPYKLKLLFRHGVPSLR